ncbi:MAG: hypothetical protein RLZZ28_208 [Bacteroidota bacterium]|jgi:O-antigen/teichoic acid export membrane protein
MAGLFAKINNRHFLSLAGSGSMAVLAMATVAILYRSLSPHDIGTWFFFQTVFVLLDTFRTGFLQVALIKFYTGTEEPRASEVLGSVWYLALMITAILCALNLLAVPFLPKLNNDSFRILIQWFGITFLTTLPLTIAAWILQAHQRFDKLLILRVVNQGSFLVMVLALILFKQISLTAVLVTNLSCNILVSLICILSGWTKLRSITKKTRDCVREVFHFGKYSVGTTISSNLLRSSDSFIIMFILGPAGPAALAMYNIPLRLMEVIEIPLRSFLATGMPSLSEAFNKNRKDEVAVIMQKYAGMLTLALIPVSLGGILLANVAIGIVGGEKYIGTYAVSIFRIFMSFAWLYPVDRFLGVTLDIIHKPRINFIKVLVMLSTNILFDFIGYYVVGNLNGIAIATLFNFLSGVLFGYYWLSKYLDISMKGIFLTGYREIKQVVMAKLLRK